MFRIISFFSSSVRLILMLITLSPWFENFILMVITIFHFLQVSYLRWQYLVSYFFIIDIFMFCKCDINADDNISMLWVLYLCWPQNFRFYKDHTYAGHNISMICESYINVDHSISMFWDRFILCWSHDLHRLWAYLLMFQFSMYLHVNLITHYLIGQVSCAWCCSEESFCHM